MRFRTVLSGGVVAACLAATTACEPIPPPPVFTVTEVALLPDADPGDGICEATPGGGDCTLLAAVDEGNSLGRATVVLTHDHPVVPDLNVSGEITIRSDGARRHYISYHGGPLSTVVVTAEGSLTVETIQIDAAIQVHGWLSLVDSHVESATDPALDVRPGGRAAVGGSILRAFQARAVQNGGAVLLVDSMVGGEFLYAGTSGLSRFQLGGVDTLPGGSTYLRDTWLASNAGNACHEEMPISLGGNRAPDTTCELDGPGDVENAPTFVINPGVTSPF